MTYSDLYVQYSVFWFNEESISFSTTDQYGRQIDWQNELRLIGATGFSLSPTWKFNGGSIVNSTDSNQSKII